MGPSNLDRAVRSAFGGMVFDVARERVQLMLRSDEDVEAIVRDVRLGNNDPSTPRALIATTRRLLLVETAQIEDRKRKSDLEPTVMDLGNLDSVQVLSEDQPPYGLEMRFTDQAIELRSDDRRLLRTGKVIESASHYAAAGQLDDDRGGVVRLHPVAFVGGFGILAPSDRQLTAGFSEWGITLHPAKQGSIPWTSVDDFSLTGHEEFIEGSGFIGGGFGVEGFLIGAAAATLLSALSSERHEAASILWLHGPHLEAALAFAGVAPDALRLQIAAPICAWRRTRPRQVSNGLAAEMEALVRLHESGNLTSEEFDTAKWRLLGERP